MEPTTGKRRGTHTRERLTARGAEALKKPGRYADGRGLYLYIDPNGRKRWIARVTVKGYKRCDIGLGGFLDVTLAEARRKASEVRTEARNGRDPVRARREHASTVPTFEQAAKAVHAENVHRWANRKHGQQWQNTLTQYAFPRLGRRSVAEITVADVILVLSPLWKLPKDGGKPETASRLNQRIKAVLDWAHAKGHRPHGGLDKDAVLAGLPRINRAALVKHRPAVPYADIPQFVCTLRSSVHTMTSARLALELQLLTALRPSEALGARWEEFDTVAAVWVVPAARMKKKREHRVPLCPRALAIVEECRQFNSEYLFAGRDAEKPVSIETLENCLFRISPDHVPHGFRSSFEDWAADCTDFPAEIREAALAHVVPDKVTAAYRRTDFWEKRKELMLSWAAYVQSGLEQSK